MKLLKSLSLVIAMVSASFAHAELSSGTGFFITSSGYIATNNHVIDSEGTISVRLSNGKFAKATVVRQDRQNDLAIIKVEGGGYKSLNLQPSTDVKRGTKSYTLGFPLPTLQGVESKLTDGIISSLSGAEDAPTNFQISNPIQPGASGSPLFTEDGKVIGVVVSTLSTIETAQIANGLTQNINYAVKSSYLIEMMNSVSGLRYKQNLSAPENPPKKLVDVVQNINNGIVLIIVDNGRQPPQASSAQDKPSPPVKNDVSACDKAWNALVETKQVNNLKILVENDCGRLHTSGWLKGTGKSNPNVCRPPWFALEDAKMLENAGVLVARDCPVMSANGIHIKK